METTPQQIPPVVMNRVVDLVSSDEEQEDDEEYIVRLINCKIDTVFDHTVQQYTQEELTFLAEQIGLHRPSKRQREVSWHHFSSQKPINFPR